MTDHKYTDEEVIRALECCAHADCMNCPRWSEEWTSGMCADFLSDVLDLVNRQRAEIAALVSAVDNSTEEFLKLHDEYQNQKAEIERLTIEYAGFRGAANSLKMHYNNARAEAIKEFAERVKAHTAHLFSGVDVRYIVDELVADVTDINVGDK